MLTINPNYPSRVESPFRSSAGARLAPPIAAGTLGPTREVNATLLRENPAVPNDSLFAYSSANMYDSTNRNPYFRYQGLERLGNLVTTRSNVYAVWITVGYFEATPGLVDVAHPDGYRLGRKLGIDTGEIERHRAFYIIDRTLPVGFQRGKDLNAEKAILVNRYIE